LWSLWTDIAVPLGQNREIRRLLRRQHGVVTRRQLLDLGVTKSGISHRLRMGRLRPLHRGVFIVGGREVGGLERWMAAVLACGPGSLLSHQSAAELWGIRKPAGGPIEVSVPATARHRPRGIRVHRRSGLTDLDRAIRSGIPVTNPSRTLADLAGSLSPEQLEAAINEADKLDRIDPIRLRETLEQLRGQRGAGTVLRVLDRRTFRLTDSELERRFLRLVRSAGLAMPQTGVRVNGFRVDFFWPELGLVVETDGLRYHRTPAQQAKDRRRDQVHTAAGLTTLRFTHAQIRFEAADVEGLLIAVVERLSRRRRAA
jgi:very-short-patch-repair endonuclease